MWPHARRDVDPRFATATARDRSSEAALAEPRTDGASERLRNNQHMAFLAFF